MTASMAVNPGFLFDEVSVFIRGMVMGVAIAAPVGPVGLLCIRRTLQKGLLVGLASGLGAALADMLFAGLAAFGVTVVVDWLTGYEKEIRLFGGLFILVMALHSLFKKVVVARNPEASASGIFKAFASGFFITLSNPLTIIGILAVVATFAGHLLFFQALTLTAAIFCGSAAWWLLLSGGVYLIRHHFTDAAIGWVNRITAMLLLLLAGWAIITGLGASFGVPLQPMLGKT